jgi:hypothetical protein
MPTVVSDTAFPEPDVGDVREGWEPDIPLLGKSREDQSMIAQLAVRKLEICPK